MSVILNAINEKTGLNGRQVGNIDIFDNFSFVEIAEANASDFYKFMGETYIGNVSVHIEPARPREKSKKRNENNNQYKNNKKNRKSRNFNPHRKEKYQKNNYQKNTYSKIDYQTDSNRNDYNRKSYRKKKFLIKDDY